MTDPVGAVERVLLLGETESRYGQSRLERLSSGRVACVLSVGADPESPALEHKGAQDVPNEDAVLVVEAENRVLLAVADAHFGAFASHAMLRGLHEALPDVPASPAALLRALRTAVPPEDATTESEASLLVAVYRRDLRAAFGFSFGDATCAALGGRHEGRPLNRQNDAFVRPTEPATLSPDRASFFECDLPEEGLLLVFTDGIDRCHYRSPDTSLGPSELVELYARVGPKPEQYARALAEWALRGRDGFPGGQDNIALAVTSA